MIAAGISENPPLHSARLGAACRAGLSYARRQRSIANRTTARRTGPRRSSEPSFVPLRHGFLALSTGCALANADDKTRAAELSEVRAIASGDEGAFARLIDRESPRLL